MTIARQMTMTNSTRVIGQSMKPSTAMLLRTAAAGRNCVQVSEFSMIQAELAAVVMRAASAPGNWSVK